MKPLLNVLLMSLLLITACKQTDSTENSASSENESSDSRLTIGEIRGRIMGANLSQVEEEFGCINYIDESDEKCPGQMVGSARWKYNFVVYKGIVKDRDGKTQDLIFTVIDWGKKYSKVTYVGIYNGKIDPYELCQD